MKHLHDDLEAAQAAHAAAQANLAKVHARHKAAAAALSDAGGARERLVADASRGVEIAPKALTAAETDMQTAEQAANLWREALAGAEAAVQEAEKPVKEAQRAIADHRFALACRSRIDASAAMMRASRELSAAYAAWLAGGEEISAAWVLGRTPDSHEIESMRDYTMAAGVVPAPLQRSVAFRGSVTEIDLHAREVNTWGRWAAPAGTEA
jgi:hypothetical protein